MGLYDPIAKRPGIDGGSTGCYAFEFLDDYITFNTCDGTNCFHCRGGKLECGRWYHVAGVYDGTNLICYLNGRPGEPVPASVVLSTHEPLYIGSGVSDPDRIYNGLIDELAVYDRALSASEIKALYDAGVAGKSPSPETRAGVR